MSDDRKSETTEKPVAWHRLSNEQRKYLKDLPSNTMWSCVCGLLIVVEGPRPPEIIDAHGRIRTPTWNFRSDFV